MARTNPTTYLPGLRRFMEGRKIVYVAGKLGIDTSTLSLLIDCKRGASLAMARRIAAYFDTSIESLLEESSLTAA